MSDQDAKPVREPEPIERSMPEIKKGLPVQESNASAIHHPGWKGFLRHSPDKEGWFEFAECKVRLENFPRVVTASIILSERHVSEVVSLFISYLETPAHLNVGDRISYYCANLQHVMHLRQANYIFFLCLFLFPTSRLGRMKLWVVV